MNQKPGEFQREFLHRIEQQFAVRSRMIARVSEVLNVGRDAVYRRLRGDTALNADELLLLARTFGIPLDAGEPPAERPPVLTYANGARRITCELEYFRQLRELTLGIVNLPGVSIDYATPELPIFYELATPMMRAFKVFMYGITTWSLDKWQHQKFSPDLIHPEAQDLAEAIISDAYNIPGRELWSIGILDVTLRQINYLSQVDRFAKREYLDVLFEELLMTVDHLEAMVRRGKRYPMGSEPHADSPDFRVYHNELSNTNNAILVKSDRGRTLFSTLVSPNYLVTEDERICNDVEQWFGRLVENGNSLNYSSSKYNQQYFAQLRVQIEAYQSRIRVGERMF